MTKEWRKKINGIGNKNGKVGKIKGGESPPCYKL